MRLRFSLFLFFLNIPQLTYGQEAVFDDFKFPETLLDYSIEDVIGLYKMVAPHHAHEDHADVDSAKILAKTIITKSLKAADSLSIGRGYLMLGRLAPVDTSCLNRSIEYTETLINSDYPTLPYMHKFQYYFEHGDYRKANKSLLLTKLYNNSWDINFNINNNLNLLNIVWGDTNIGLKGLIHDQKIIRSKEFDDMQRLLDWGDVRNELLTSNFYSIADGFYNMDSLSLANTYLDSLKSYGLKYNFPETIDNYNGLKGAILYKQGAYTEALAYTNTYLNNSIENDNYGISRSSVIKGLILWELQEKELAIASLSTADSLYQITHDEFEELGDGYKTLITYYKEKGDKDKQLEFLNKLIVFDEEITANYLEIAPAITRSYTIPELLSEKEVVIKELSTNNQINEQKKTVYYILLMVASLIIGYFIIQRILFKRRFEKIKKKLEQAENQRVIKKQRSEGQELFELDAKQIERIAKGLERFENERGYVNTRLSLKSLATSMDTNSSYLSKYINAIKGVNFSHYVNTLRINAIIEVLQVNAKIRAYTIDAIAEEAGFSNTRSFSNHFKRVTGINPSYFLKQLKKEQNANEVPTPQTV